MEGCVTAYISCPVGFVVETVRLEETELDREW